MLQRTKVPWTDVGLARMAIRLCVLLNSRKKRVFDVRVFCDRYLGYICSGTASASSLLYERNQLAWILFGGGTSHICISLELEPVRLVPSP